MTLSAITEKAKSIAKTRVSPDFAFSTSWFYGFCKFFRISCRLAAEASGSDRLEIDELNVPNSPLASASFPDLCFKTRLELFFAREFFRQAALQRFGAQPVYVSVDQVSPPYLGSHLRSLTVFVDAPYAPHDARVHFRLNVGAQGDGLQYRTIKGSCHRHSWIYKYRWQDHS